jgi:hypothetical protein
MTFEEALASWPWTPIPRCPGRFVLPPSAVTPQQLLRADSPLDERRVAGARDPVVAAQFPGGGLITYRQGDGRYVHTLNTADGFARKLRQLGLAG